MFDSHLHTIFSTDSNMQLKDALCKSKEEGIGLIITEHMDLKYPIKDNFIFDVNEYFKCYSEYRGDELLLGMEMGLRTDCIEENFKLLKEYAFDYIIGSVHLVNGVDIYDQSYYEGKSKYKAYSEYFEYMLSCVKKYTFIDSLGHIDYIARYAKYSDTEVYYKDYRNFIDEILRTVIHNDIVMEINTRRISNKETTGNLLQIYKRFKELGGEYVTIGSDAHRASDIGQNFYIGKEIAEACSLKIVHFKERKIILSK